MDECFAQDEPVRFDCDGGRSENVTRAAEQLSRLQGGNSIYSVPLRAKEGVQGVMTLEFAPPAKMPPDLGQEIMVAAEVLSPHLRDRYDNDRWIAVKVGHSIQNVGRLTIGPKHMLVKLIILLVIGAGLFITFFKPMYHVDCHFTLEATNKRVVCAPFEGILRDDPQHPPVHYGQHVTKNQIMAEMNADQLKLELAKAQSDRNRAWETYRACVVERDPAKAAQVAIYKAEVDSADADIAIKLDKVDRAILRAPFDGIVLIGDLQDKVGTSVKTGEPLFEISPDNVLRAQLDVAERDIQDLRQPGDDSRTWQKGKLAVGSMPWEKIDFTVESVEQVGQPKEGENYFKVYGRLDHRPGNFAPGLEGQASIEVEHRRLVWIWTHRLVDFLYLHLWL